MSCRSWFMKRCSLWHESNRRNARVLIDTNREFYSWLRESYLSTFIIFLFLLFIISLRFLRLSLFPWIILFVDSHLQFCLFAELFFCLWNSSLCFPPFALVILISCLSLNVSRSFTSSSVFSFSCRGIFFSREFTVLRSATSPTPCSTPQIITKSKRIA